jgi:hypothetical protein
MRILFYFVPGLLIIVTGMISCSTKNKTPEKEPAREISFRVERAPEWTTLFNRTSGWFGGDGIFAIPYSGVEVGGDHGKDSILFLFSDTMVGEIVGNKLTPGYTMVNNSVAMLRGNEPVENNLRFLVAKDDAGKPSTVFVPKTSRTAPGDYYWLGDGFVNHARDSSLYIFAYRIHNTDTKELFPFREVGNALIVIPHKSKFPFTDHRQLDTPFFFEGKEEAGYGSLGAGILVNTVQAGGPSADGFIYVYGVRGKAKEMIAARVAPEAFEQFDAWQFWDGSAWTADLTKMGAIADSVSNEFSVTPLPDGRFALVYQYGGIYPTIYMQVGESPVGPFGPRKKVWDTKNDIQDPDLFTYNAKAHPVISQPGELLISYNVNSFKFNDVIESRPNLYRPRFIRVVFEQ